MTDVKSRLHALAAQAQAEDARVAQALSEKDALAADIERFEADYGDVLAGFHTQAKEELRAELERLRDRKREVVHSVAADAPAEEFILRADEITRERGLHALIRFLKTDGVKRGYFRLIVGEELKRERAQRPRLCVGLGLFRDDKGNPAALFPADAERSGGARFAVAQARHALYQAFEALQKEDAAIKRLLVQRSFSDKIDWERLLNPKDPGYVVPQQPPGAGEVKAGTYGFGIWVDFTTAHPRTQRDEHWSGALNVAFRPYEDNGIHWKTMWVSDAVGPIRRVIPGTRIFLLPPISGEIPFNRLRGGTSYRMPSRAVRALVSAIREAWKNDSAACIERLHGKDKGGILEQIATRHAKRQKREERIAARKAQRAEKRGRGKRGAKRSDAPTATTAQGATKASAATATTPPTATTPKAPAKKPPAKKPAAKAPTATTPKAPAKKPLAKKPTAKTNGAGGQAVPALAATPKPTEVALA